LALGRDTGPLILTSFDMDELKAALAGQGGANKR